LENLKFILLAEVDYRSRPFLAEVYPKNNIDEN
jgi:hypothetical protein